MTKNNKKNEKKTAADIENKNVSSTPEREHGQSLKATGESPLLPDMAEQLTRLTETNRQLKRKIFDLYTIFEISRNFNAVLRYESLLDSFILTSLAQVSASKAAIFLKENSQSNKFVIAKGKGSGEFPGPDKCFDATSELALFLGKLNRPVVTEELLNDNVTETERNILTLFHPGLVIPMIFQTRLSGILLISEKLSGKDFGLDDIEFLSILASQIAVAIENARLYEAEKMATKQLRAAQQQLVNSERLVALGEMSARVAHEVNNPLSIIKNYLLLIRRSVGQNIEACGYLDIVGQEIDRIAHIVKELLDFHRPSRDHMETVDMISVVDDVLMLMDRQMETLGIELVKQYDSDCPMFKGSTENIKQVILNLVINACDAMNNGGKLKVEIKNGGNELITRFYDTGPGIPPEIIPRIFEPFFTTKQPGEGTGLGLAVCYGIIRRHGGTITYINTKEGGCFEIRLPSAGCE